MRAVKKELLHEMMELYWVGDDARPWVFKEIVGEWLRDCAQDWASTRKGIPRPIRSGRLHLTLTYHPDDD